MENKQKDNAKYVGNIKQFKHIIDDICAITINGKVLICKVQKI
jgi:hypothetical protein